MLQNLTRIQLVQLAVAGLHALAVVAIVSWTVAASSSYDHMWRMVWLPLFWWDLPATVGLFLSWAGLPDSLFDDVARMFYRAHPFDDLANFWLPLLWYGVGGTLWWYLLTGWLWRAVQLTRALFGRV